MIKAKSLSISNGCPKLLLRHCVRLLEKIDESCWHYANVTVKTGPHWVDYNVVEIWSQNFIRLIQLFLCSLQDAIYPVDLRPSDMTSINSDGFTFIMLAAIHDRCVKHRFLLRRLENSCCLCKGFYQCALRSTIRYFCELSIYLPTKRAKTHIPSTQNNDLCTVS